MPSPPRPDPSTAATPAAGRIRVGISGWRYPPWRGAFYPAGLRQQDELAYVAHRLPTVEINGSFYALQTPASYARWYAATPPGFVFSVKASRYITHQLRLREAAAALPAFFASGLLGLREKLGPVLWQLPPSLAFDAATVEAFVAALPADTAAAQALAQRADRAAATDAVRPLRHALEVRHPSFVDARFVALLRRHRVALVVADTGGRWPELVDATADFVYLRLHGAAELYLSRYTEAQLDDWAARMRAWARGAEPPGRRAAAPMPAAPRDVYAYFDNTDKPHAPDNACALLRRLGLDWSPAGAPVPRNVRRRGAAAAKAAAG